MKQDAGPCLISQMNFGIKRKERLIGKMVRMEEKVVAFSLSLETVSNTPDAAYIWDQLAAYNRVHSEDDNHQVLNLFLRDAEGNLAGGMLADTAWGWLAISIFWLREDIRGQGWGTRLLQEAEAEAIRRGCTNAQVDSHDFQAPGFYQKHGYEVWGVLEDMPPGHRRVYMKKRLV